MRIFFLKILDIVGISLDCLVKFKSGGYELLVFVESKVESCLSKLWYVKIFRVRGNGLVFKCIVGEIE